MIRSPAGFDGGDRIKRYLDYYQPSYGVMMLSAGQFSPLSLFAAGEQGAWYDPSDLSTMFQDAAGTTPVTAVEQPVGLLLDKSKGLALGAELVTNGDFSSNTWWSTGGGAAISGGALNFTAAVATSGAYRLGFATVGKYYELTFEIVSISSGGVQITLGNSSGTNRTAAGVYTQRILCTGNGNLTLYSVGASTTASVDNVSIKEVQGNHASQSTAASRPVLSARVNLLTYSEQFDNAAWTKQNVTVASNSVVAPNGATTADTLTDDATSGRHTAVQAVTVASGVSYTVTGRFKAGTGSFAFLCLSDAGASAYTAVLNMADGTISQTRSAGVTGASSSVTVLSGGWYLVTITCNAPASTSYVYAGMAGAATGNTFDGAGVPIYSGSGSTIYLWGADLRVTNVGVGLPAYQRVAAATDYDTSGFPLYLKFDGTDDSLATGTIDPGAVDKAQVFAGVRKISGTGFQAAVGYGRSQAGAYYLYAPTSVKADYGLYTVGNTGSNNKTTDATFTPPISGVVSGFIDGALAQATQVTMRVNGSSAALSAGGAMTLTSIGAEKIYLGRRENADLPFNGNLYSAIVRFGANLSDAQIASTETWVNGKTGAY